VSAPEKPPECRLYFGSAPNDRRSCPGWLGVRRPPGNKIGQIDLLATNGIALLCLMLMDRQAVMGMQDAELQMQAWRVVTRSELEKE
jgi:hypothetical protein